MIPPAEIQALAEPVEGIYIRISNDLLGNIARHIRAPTWTNTARWEVQKLSELGQLTAENAAIINRYIQQIPAEVRATMTAARQAALADVEKQLAAAAQAGYLTPPVHDSVPAALQALIAQADERLNLTNTQMLQSSLDRYVEAINAVDRYQQGQPMPQEGLDILNTRAAALVLGTQVPTEAIRGAIRDLAEQDITGFIDKAGRHWTPEAYVNMVMRTTVHNTAITGIRERMKDYGTDVFQISAHAGARPLCAPYQGWYCSWGSGAGEIELGNGEVVEYVDIDDTSYGEAAGIFGVNCGHYPIPVVAGYSIPSAQDNIQDPETNAREYKDSQIQRALEREIREAKRIVLALGPLATKEDKDRVKQAQADMRAFIERTGRTRRYEREQVEPTAAKKSAA